MNNQTYSRQAQQSRVLDIAAETQKRFMEQMASFQNNMLNSHRSFMSNLARMHDNAEKDGEII